jgi:predicted secreted protein
MGERERDMGTVFAHGDGPGRKTTIFPLLGGLVLVIAMISAGCLDQSFDAGSNGTTAAVEPGETVHISLDETPSTGYVWNVTLAGDLVVTKTEFGSLGALTGMPGGDSGTRTWYLTVGQAATQKFSAVKMRRGDNPERIVDRFEMTFVLKTDKM